MIQGSAVCAFNPPSVAGATATNWYASSMFVRAITVAQWSRNSCWSRERRATSAASGAAVRRDDSTGSSSLSSRASITCGSREVATRSGCASEDGGGELIDRAQHVGIVGEGLGDRASAGGVRRDTEPHELCRMHEQPGGGTFVEPAAFELPRHVCKAHELCRRLLIDEALRCHDLRFEARLRIVEFDRDETLARALLQVLQHGLVAGVVREGEKKLRRRRKKLSVLVDRQDAAIVREWM